MATIQKRGDSWRVIVRKKGVSKTATFAKKQEANAWAVATEAAIIAGERGEVPDKTFGQLLERYRDDITPNKRGGRWEAARINKLIREAPITAVKLASLDAPHFARWRDDRLKDVSAASVRREWNLLSSACNIAVKEWRWLKRNPMADATRPESAPPRDRRITLDEVEKLLFVSGYSFDVPPCTMSARVGAAFLFAIETAMRAGEILALSWADISLERSFLAVGGGKTVAAKRHVPLTTEAVRILHQLRALNAGDPVFQIRAATLDALFRKFKDKAGITDLHFHDTRHEGITRLAQKLDVLALARTIGHRDLKQLLVYYNESAEDMAKRL